MFISALIKEIFVHKFSRIVALEKKLKDQFGFYVFIGVEVEFYISSVLNDEDLN